MAVIDQIFAAVCVMLLLGAFVLVVRRRQGGALWPAMLSRKSAGLLAQEDRLALGPQHCLHVIRLDGRRILVATHPGGVTFGPEPESFAGLLARTGRSTEANPS